MDNTTAQRRSNRRLLARHACTLTVQYRSEVGWHPATAMDLSRNGCRLRVGEHLRRDATLAIVFGRTSSRDTGAVAVQVLGTVMWCRPEGLSYQAGLAFSGDTTPLDVILQELL